MSRVTVMCALAILTGCSDDVATGPQGPVATVAVSLSRESAYVGTPVTATATLRNAAGDVLTRTIAWTSSDPLVATVNADGTITTIGGGFVTITATSEGHAASAQLLVATSVAQVTITGVGVVTVGQRYQFTSELRGWNGAIIQRPIAWSVTSPQAGTITAAGELTPLTPGAITVRATIENVTYDRTVVAVSDT